MIIWKRSTIHNITNINTVTDDLSGFKACLSLVRALTERQTLDAEKALDWIKLINQQILTGIMYDMMYCVHYLEIIKSMDVGSGMGGGGAIVPNILSTKNQELKRTAYK